MERDDGNVGRGLKWVRADAAVTASEFVDLQTATGTLTETNTAPTRGRGRVSCFKSVKFGLGGNHGATHRKEGFAAKCLAEVALTRDS